MASNEVHMIPCGMCGGWSTLAQGKRTVFGRCGLGHRIYGLTGQTIDELVHALRGAGGQVLSIRPDAQPSTNPGGAERADNGARIRRDPEEWL